MQSKTVLCIEDDRFIGEMYVRSLRKAGYSVDWVIDGNDGLIVAQNQPYDVILLDVMLPEKRGTEILSTLRGEEDLIPSLIELPRSQMLRIQPLLKLFHLRIMAIQHFLILMKIQSQKLCQNHSNLKELNWRDCMVL